jgi:hypothetical protein
MAGLSAGVLKHAGAARAGKKPAGQVLSTVMYRYDAAARAAHCRVPRAVSCFSFAAHDEVRTSDATVQMCTSAIAGPAALIGPARRVLMRKPR